MLATLQSKNKNLTLYHVNNPMFLRYGIVHGKVNCEPLLEHLSKLTPPTKGYQTVLADHTVTSHLDCDAFSHLYFGGQPIQAGYCMGLKNQLDVVEYHNSSEIMIALTDMIVAVGHRKDLWDDYSYQSKHIRGFYVNKGDLIELYATTLHSAPFHVHNDGFKVIRITAEGTGEPLMKETKTPLFRRNQWLLGHPEATHLEAGICKGLVGNNYKVKY